MQSTVQNRHKAPFNKLSLVLIRGLRLRLTAVLCWRTYPQAPDSPNYSVLGTLDDTYRTGKPAALPPSLLQYKRVLEY